MERSITIRDFSGGLNTAIDAGRLPANQTASLSNVDILDSGAISRRSGYGLFQTIAASKRVGYIGRFYALDGTKRWIALAGTTVYSCADLTKTTPPTTVNVESLAATSVTLTGVAQFGGGAAVYLAATATTYSVPVPYSNWVHVRGFGAFKASVDGGAYSSSTAAGDGATYVAWSGLTATTHTLAIKSNAGSRNTYSLRVAITPSAAKNYGIAVYKALSAKRIVSLWVSDYNAATTKLLVNYAAVVPTKTWTTGGAGSGTHLLYSVPTGTTVTSFGISYSDYTETAVARTSYFDSVCADGVLVDDIPTAAGWIKSEVAGSTATVDAGEWPPSWDSVPVRAYIDLIIYSATPTFARIAGVSATATTFSMAQLNNKVYFATPYNALRSYDGTTVAAITASGTAPPAGHVVQLKRRLHVVGKATDPAIIEYSAVDSGNDWTNGGSLRPTGKDSGGETTGLIAWQDALFYFAKGRVNGIDTTGPEANWQNKVLSTSLGCTAPKTLVAAPNGLIFLSGNSVRTYGSIPGVNTQDGSGFSLLSEEITPTLERINTAYAHLACGAFWRGRYYLSVPLDSATDNSHTLVYRLATERQRGAWTVYGYGVTCFCVTRGDEEWLYGGTAAGTLLKLETGSTDAGAQITMSYKVPLLSDRSGYSTVKHFRRALFGADAPQATELSVTPYTDDEPGDAVSVPISAGTSTRPARVALNARGRALGLDISSIGSNQDVSISEITLTYVPGRIR